MPPTLDQIRDWQQRLSRLCDEMENAYGEPGEHNQDPLDSAVHVAFYVATHEVRQLERMLPPPNPVPSYAKPVTNVARPEPDSATFSRTERRP